jgi:ABC-2 type transport system permease protein
MKFAYLVAWREYAENAKTKGFWIGIFVLPVILFLSIQAPIWLDQKGTPVRYYVLVDQSGSFERVVDAAVEKTYQKRTLEALKEYARKHSIPSKAVSSQLLQMDENTPRTLDSFIALGGKEYFVDRLKPELKLDAPAFIAPRRLFQRVPLPRAIDSSMDLHTLADHLKPYLLGQKQLEGNGQPVELSAAILIPRRIEDQIVRPTTEGSTPGTKTIGVSHPQADSSERAIQFWSVNASDPRLRDELDRAINQEVRRREYVGRGMNLADIRQVEQTYAPLVSLDPKKAKGKEAMSQSDVIRQWAPSAFVYLLWLSIFVIVQMLLNNTIEEKSNRIIEVLLSSVTPSELMMGKLMGIAAVGLTMVGAWMAALFGILSWKSGGASELAGNLLMLLKSSNLLPMFSLYFLMGYLMYAAFILSIGSVCNTIKEAQSYMGVLTMIMMVPILTMTFIPKDPNGTLARVLSWIPIYSPFTMMNRAAADPPMFDLVGTMVMMLVTTVGGLWMAGKIFRIGILRTGQPPKVLEMLRWIRRKDL